MDNLILIIPFIISLFLLIFFHKKVVWWEYLLLIIPAIIINIVVAGVMKFNNCKDVQYLGDYVKELRYYEEWDEWVIRRCNRTYTDSRGQTHVESYDCSYCDSHPARWEAVTFLHNRYLISEIDFNEISSIWKSPIEFVDMHRDYYTKDGDLYLLKWNDNYETIIPITMKDTYRNKVKGSKSIFKFESINEEEAAEIGLFDYPKLTVQEITHPKIDYIKTYQKSVLGYKNDQVSKRMDYINAKYGPTLFIRTYILVYNNKPREIAFKQQSYWEGGNFNEHIICLGLDSITKKIDWCETFSWEDNPQLAVKTKQWFIEHNNIDSLVNFTYWYENNLKSNSIWICKDDIDFDYLKTELTSDQLIWLLVISVIICMGISIWVILNNYEYDKKNVDKT